MDTGTWLEMDIETWLEGNTPMIETPNVDSKYEILEGRIAALEKELQKSAAPDEKEVSSDERMHHIFEAVTEFCGLRQGDRMQFTPSELQRGIRKALNHFYRGPYKGSNDQTARINSLIEVNENVRKLNTELLHEKEKLEENNRVLSGTISQLNAVVASHKDAERRLSIVRIALNTTDPEGEIIAMQGGRD